MREKTRQLDTRVIWSTALFLLLLSGSACNVSRDIDIANEDGGVQDMDSGLQPRRDMRRNLDAACASVSAKASLTKKPVDIIFVIDNSSSMEEEIQGVQDNINASFADIIRKSGLDYRVIMVTQHGSVGVYRVCIKAPLSGTSCAPVPWGPVFNPPIFYHYSTLVDSYNSLDALIKTYDGSRGDEYSLAPHGWAAWLRPEAFKVFVELTDDNARMLSASSFDKNLLAMVPNQFGTAANRNYVWHSIVGVAANTNPKDPWLPSVPVVASKCLTAENSGSVYQELSILTGGLRFPLCDTTSYDSIFNSIAQGVVSGAKIACDFPLPPPPAGEVINLNTVLVTYTPMGIGTPETFRQVSAMNQCTAGAFYIEKNRIYLCPNTCQQVQQDNQAALSILFDCADIVG